MPWTRAALRAGLGPLCPSRADLGPRRQGSEGGLALLGFTLGPDPLSPLSSGEWSALSAAPREGMTSWAGGSDGPRGISLLAPGENPLASSPVPVHPSAVSRVTAPAVAKVSLTCGVV